MWIINYKCTLAVKEHTIFKIKNRRFYIRFYKKTVVRRDSVIIFINGMFYYQLSSIIERILKNISIYHVPSYNDSTKISKISHAFQLMRVTIYTALFNSLFLVLNLVG